jgi:hypothetical protein
MHVAATDVCTDKAEDRRAVSPLRLHYMHGTGSRADKGRSSIRRISGDCNVGWHVNLVAVHVFRPAGWGEQAGMPASPPFEIAFAQAEVISMRRGWAWACFGTRRDSTLSLLLKASHALARRASTPHGPCRTGPRGSASRRDALRLPRRSLVDGTLRFTLR